MNTSERVQERVDSLHSPWHNIVYLGRYWLDISGTIPIRSRGRRHRLTDHIVLYWEEQGKQHLGVASLDLGVWRTWQIHRRGKEFLGMEIVEERVEPGNLEERRAAVQVRVEEKRRDLEERGLDYGTL